MVENNNFTLEIKRENTSKTSQGSYLHSFGVSEPMIDSSKHALQLTLEDNRKRDLKLCKNHLTALESLIDELKPKIEAQAREA